MNGASPAPKPDSGLVRLHTLLPLGTWIGVMTALFAVIAIALLTLRSLQLRSESDELLTHTLDTVASLEGLLSAVKDAETGQRGYMLTGNTSYQDPLSAALGTIPAQLQRATELVSDQAAQRQRMESVRSLVEQKLEIINGTIRLYSAGEPEEALAIVRTDRGKAIMDSLRSVISEMTAVEEQMLQERQATQQSASRLSFLVTLGGSFLLLLLVTGAAMLASRDFRARQALNWVRSGQLGLATRLQGEQRLEVLGERVLQFLASYMDARVGAVYVREGGDSYRHVASHAVVPFTAPAQVRAGEGLLGQAVHDGKLMRVSSIPAGYLTVGSALGGAEPHELLIVPAKADGQMQAVFELAFFRDLEEVDLQMLSYSSEALGIAIRSARDRTQLETLLEETQRQGEELQTQQEELRVSNEELEEQSRALMDSKQRLESQHEELEQTNNQLTDQASALSRQKEALQKAQVVLSEKAAELERTNQYKSEFLANMSHELRTPLNSALILSKLLADNKGGNLTPEQVRFAETISGAGNDLLALINDVLDLSKIEAGKIELEPRSVALAPLVEGVIRSLRMDAKQKQLELLVEVDPTTPEQITTDPGRLTQILRNLLSNALKFTEKGSVRLYLHAPRPGEVSLAVIDTGIGIAAHQHEIIFEAFRQADGSTHRKHGGTGLGLSISRDLARLLGGDLTVASQPGAGSTFTLLLPVVYSAQVPAVTEPPTLATTPERAGFEPARRRAAPPPMLQPLTPAAVVTPPHELALADDRDNLTREARSILVIEDDPRFALILRDLAREMQFQCIVCFTGKEGLELASRYLPSAILLDINLPDQSGLSVLDQLKGDPGTRHIPVHVVSVMDYTHHAMERGAVGYALKPVKREELIGALQKIEARLAQTVRRVLVVEDDERQRESMQALLGNPEVEIIAVATAAQAFEQLQSKTFDCMVLDLTLPDASGRELLERMSANEELSFPPVIIYTGQRLSRQQEEELQRYSRSIILKDARSPERLLDEVMLFLHQVEDRLLPEQRQLLKTGRDRDATLDGRRVLIVEDDVRNIFALTSLLEPRGIKVAIARNGLEAIAALDDSQNSPETQIDLVLMDIMMPQMDGLTAMRHIRERREFRKLPIIALTAKTMPDDQRKCLEAGASDYMAKPLDVDKLFSLIRVWMPRA